MSTDGPVRIEILARKDCDSLGMAVAVVDRVVAEMGVHAEIEVIAVASLAEAVSLRFLGSPTVRVDGRDVDKQPNGYASVTLDDRVYRTERGLAGWPDAEWVREAILLAVAGTTANGDHGSSTTANGGR